MSEKLPPIYVGADKTTVLTKVHDHSREAYGHDGVVKCDDPNCRADLILAGGLEMVNRKWYFALGEAISVTIAQSGQKNRDGSSYCHIHEPYGKDHSIECDSPDCNAFFQADWTRYQILKRGSLPGRAIASPEERVRPKSIEQMDREDADFQDAARRAAAIEQEVRKVNLQTLWPLPR